MSDINYHEQMLNYYPEVFKAIREFKALIATQSFQVNEMHEKLEELLSNSFIGTADENRIAMWEKYLGITPPSKTEDQEYEDWLTSRRDVILARLYQSEKLNTKSIEDIVSIFTGNIAESWIIDGTLYVKVYPSESNKNFSLDNIKAALESKRPAHLDLCVYKNYATWNSIKSNFATWGDIPKNLDTWETVKYFMYTDDYNVDVFEYIVDEQGNSIMDESNNRLFN